jgi:hypothetical protein
MKNISPGIFGEDKLIKNNHYLDLVYSAEDLTFLVSVAILTFKYDLIIKVRITKTVKWNLVISSFSGKEYVNEKMFLTKGENIILKKHIAEYGVRKNIIITDEGGKLILYRDFDLIIICTGLWSSG